jgi:serine/threonine-protein kinase HipA
MKSEKATPSWKELLIISFLTEEMKEKYLELLEIRTTNFI